MGEAANPCPSTAEKVAFLASGQGFWVHERPVTVIETHMSWVFLGRTVVFKMKKPVRFPFLDFSTLERRQRNCEAEVHLNRRLAGDVYQGVIALRCDPAGQLTLGPTGEIVEWLVQMRRLPHQEFLDERMRTHRLHRHDIVELAERLARFYRDAPPAIDDGEAYLRHLRVESDVNRHVLLSQPSLGVDASRTHIALNAVDALLDQWTPVIRERIAGGFIVEGHGDLKPAHICLLHPPLVFDCLEFDRNMRLLDPYDEVNLLGLECAVLGNHWVSTLLLDEVARTLGHRPDRRLIATYGAFRAILRARLCLAHLLEEGGSDKARWIHQTKRYLALAEHEVAMASG
jgi:aminoglycoside phosphotransferase family enzyme